MSVVPPNKKAFLDIKLVQECMDAHAKKIALAFAEWGFKDDNPFVEGSNGRWIQQCGNSTSWSTEELYNIFIESLNNQHDP